MFYLTKIQISPTRSASLFLVLILMLLLACYMPIANNNNIMTDAAALKVKNSRASVAGKGPTVNDPNLRVAEVFKGLDFPTSMAFLGRNDILVLEKNKGTVQRIVDGKMQPDPVLDVNVANLNERGMLGIAVAKQTNNNNAPRYVFLYYTESGGGEDGDDTAKGKEPLGNRLYRYELADDNNNNNNKLINPKLLLDLPATPPEKDTERQHMGGKVLIGPSAADNNNVYVGIGDVGGHRTEAENTADGGAPDGTGGILRVTQDGEPVGNGIIGSKYPVNLYYAYGMRNTFGMDFDPVTGILWDTDDGPTYGDEINIVNPGFNSGWSQIQGLAKDDLTGDGADPAKDLVDFDGKGKYSDPLFVWTTPIGVTSLKFLNSDKLGQQYQNTIFIGDVDAGFLYNFKPNEQRTGLLLEDPLSDKVADNPNEMLDGGIVFGKGFGVITDIQVGPDGNLYVLNLQGSIYRISPSSS